MINYTGPIVIGIVDLIILYDLVNNYNILRKSDRSIKYNRLKYNITTLLLIANTFAFLTTVIAYFYLQVAAIDLLMFGRFVDRYCMMFAYKELYSEQGDD